MKNKEMLSIIVLFIVMCFIFIVLILNINSESGWQKQADACEKARIQKQSDKDRYLKQSIPDRKITKE